MGATAMFTGTALSAGGKIYGGITKKRALDASAGLLEQEAGQSVASGIQGAIEDRRRANYVMSSARARIAGSGLATTGTSAIKTVGDIRAEGEYRALTSVYQGEDRALELRSRAAGMRMEGSAAQTAGWIGGISSVLTGGSSFYDKYGGDSPAPNYAEPP